MQIDAFIPLSGIKRIVQAIQTKKNTAFKM